MKYDEIHYWSEVKLEIVYYLFFASHKPVAAGIVKDIFDKFRTRGVS